MPRPVYDFDAETHTYRYDGEIVPSVTTILPVKDFGDDFTSAAWFGYHCCRKGRTPEEVRNESALRGTQFHMALELYAKEGLIPKPADFPEEDKVVVQALVRWISENDPEFHEAEVVTGSLEHGYAGTLDARVTLRSGVYKGQLALLDLKTSKSVHVDQYFPQLAAYEQAEVESGMDATDLQLILHLSSDGKARMHRSVDTFEDFKAILEVFRSKQRRTQRLKELKDGMAI